MFEQGTVGTDTIVVVATRHPRIAVEDWWLVLARDLIEKYPAGLVQLGKDLAELIDRRSPFSHTTLSLFANKKAGAAQDLVEALCLKFRLPPPILLPRSFAEASQMLAVKEAYDRDHERDDGADATPASVHDLEARRSKSQRSERATTAHGAGSHPQTKARTKR